MRLTTITLLGMAIVSATAQVSDESATKIKTIVEYGTAHDPPPPLQAIAGLRSSSNLDYNIGSSTWINHNTRYWAVNCAITKGVPKEHIRRALLRHAALIDSDPRLKYDFVALRRLAIEHGILED
jgi:hypothetical protein